MYQLCYRFVPHHDDASDLAQDVFVRAWKGLSRFQRRRSVHDVAVSHRGQRLPQPGQREAADTEPSRTRPLRGRQTEARQVRAARAERAEAVRRAIHALPEKQRATLILRTYHELSHQQIADILGSSVGAVKANFFHALGNLEKILGAEP